MKLKARLKLWWWNNLICLDYQLNALLFGLPGQTLSARAATARRDNRVWGCVLCALLDRIDAEHCTRALASDLARAQRVIDDLIPTIQQ